MRKVSTLFKQTIVAVTAMATLGVVGVTREAQAIDINPGDLVLALWGNTTEYLQDLGQASTLFGSTKTFTISSSVLSAVNPSGGSPLKFSIYGTNFNSFGNPVSVYGGVLNPSVITPSNTFPTNLFNQGTNQLAGLFVGDGATSLQIAASNLNSFTSTFGTSSTLAGTFSTPTSNGLGGLLNIVSVNMTGSGPFFAQLGQATLSADGTTLTLQAVQPVPVPAAVVLFGSGLIGLIGVARRSMRQQAA